MDELLCPLAKHAALSPDSIALIACDASWTYRQCDSIVRGLCLHLQNIKVKEKTRVAFIAHSTPACVFLFFALFRLRAIACPLSFREPNEKILQLIQALQDAGEESCLFIDPQLLPLHPSSARGPIPLCPGDLATCLFTSGTSGKSKIACHTLKNHWYSALGVLDFFGLNASSRWLLSLPLFHVGGLSILFRLFLAGGSVALSALPLLSALEKYAITHLSLVPTQLIRCLRDLPKEKALCHLQCTLLGGASFSQALLEEAIKRGIPLFTTYGMTEMSSIITAAKLPTSVHAGMPLAFRDCRLSADKEILVKGVPLFSGYWDADAKTLTLPCVEEAWFATRDCGEFTQEGNLRITGRKDRLFISGGENIQPEEIEKALCRIPGITFAVVVPIPDSEFGHRPIAYICDETNSHTLDSVREALSPLLPSFKHPINIFPYVTKGSFKTCE